MKKLRAILLTAILVISFTTIKAEDYKFFTIEKTDGTSQTMTAVGLTINYTDGYLVAQNRNETTKILLSDLKRMYFTNEAAAISDITDEKSLSNVTYDMQGRRITDKPLMNRGIYIIKKDGKTQKVFVK
ncbi:MAG: hypothetical protein K6E52_02320 [Bacteroidaceae bacterium]|nr:hypothetical protein [Bacteroidaceae bacterium]